MCKVLTVQSPERFAKVSRSVRISGHSTSVRLEAAFWQVLEDIAKMEGLSTSKLISELSCEALGRLGGMSNLASMLRTVCLLYQEERNTQIVLRRNT
ncbi:ribbon-helix-helix domain-containing protein [Pararhizobium sp. BT-229]|uniref:ribbon-helix-helix domain-containing protein n=1 Tax=Pararhizobium sp. BT-229 TaxID=2986923 RepID=UPI0021F6DC6B|nr:ribbon-helix-helix domain-containing protein [Pararhizobium sp. BT-229]MCV9963184.1 ribbon-helix-helix domain-containing protein [Pararhizobium sp. BT-229]